MTECNWCKDEICVNADCPICCDYCPVPDTEGVCKFEDRSERHFTVVEGRMKEYIERELAIEALSRGEGCGNVCRRAIERILAADVAPVRHGRWVSVQHKLARVCSVCNRDEPYKFADIDADVYDYCPYCGAMMDLDLVYPE